LTALALLRISLDRGLDGNRLLGTQTKLAVQYKLATTKGEFRYPPTWYERDY
jgi:hypothetical protein